MTTNPRKCGGKSGDKGTATMLIIDVAKDEVDAYWLGLERQRTKKRLQKEKTAETIRQKREKLLALKSYK